MKHIQYLLHLCLFTFFCQWSMANGHYVFTPIDGNDGLSGNKVRNITQLPDGRMVFTTEGLLNIYDGSRFNYLHYTEKNSCRLSGYTGFHHEYVGNDGYMWLKNSHLLMAIDINKERFVDNPQELLAAWGADVPLKDFFMDREKDLWLITDHDELLYLSGSNKEKNLFCQRISQTDGTPDPVYDLAVWERKLYLFYRSGMLVCYDIPSRKELYRQQSLTPLQREKYPSTSLPVSTGIRWRESTIPATSSTIATHGSWNSIRASIATTSSLPTAGSVSGWARTTVCKYWISDMATSSHCTKKMESSITISSPSPKPKTVLSGYRPPTD